MLRCQALAVAEFPPDLGDQPVLTKKIEDGRKRLGEPENPTCSGSSGRGGVADLPAWGRSDTGLRHQQPPRGAALQRLGPAGRALPRNIKTAKRAARIISAMITVAATVPVKLLL